MKRTPEELTSFIYRECSFPNGCMIMTGTGIVPGNEFTLQSGDEILIAIDTIGELIECCGIKTTNQHPYSGIAWHITFE